MSATPRPYSLRQYQLDLWREPFAHHLETLRGWAMACGDAAAQDQLMALLTELEQLEGRVRMAASELPLE